MTPRISITLPSIYPDACDRALRNIREATCGSYEVILVSPFRPSDDLREDVTWIEEPAGSGAGSNAGHSKAIAHCRGEFVTAWVDDHCYVEGWDDLAVARYCERENLFDENGPFLLGLRHNERKIIGTAFGIYYPYYPLIRRSYLDDVGWYDPKYRRGFADIDLAFRVWDAGGRVEWTMDGIVVVHPDDQRKGNVLFEPADYELFVNRWAPVFGRGWSTTNLRDFNMDIDPKIFGVPYYGFTVFQNDPGFRDRMISAGWQQT